MSVYVQIYVGPAHPLAVDTFASGSALLLADGECRVSISGEPPERSAWLREAAETMRALADKVDADHEQSQRDLAAAHAEIARLRGEA